MIDCNCIYNPSRDVAEVVQFGFIDLAECLLTNSVPNDLDTPDDAYNEIPLNEMIGRPQDVFDAMEYGSAVIAHESKKTAAAAQPPTTRSPEGAKPNE